MRSLSVWSLAPDGLHLANFGNGFRLVTGATMELVSCVDLAAGDQLYSHLINQTIIWAPDSQKAVGVLSSQRRILLVKADSSSAARQVPCYNELTICRRRNCHCPSLPSLSYLFQCSNTVNGYRSTCVPRTGAPAVQAYILEPQE